MKWLALVAVLLCAACGGAPAGAAADGPLTTTTPADSGGRASASVAAHGPVGLAVDPTGALWVADSGASQVVRVRGGAVDLTVGGVAVPLRLVAGDGSVWATAFGSGQVVRIAQDTGAVTARVDVGAGAEGVALGFGSVWVVAQDAGRLVRVDPARAAVADTVDIGLGARLVATSAAAVWVSQFQTGRVLRVDPTTRAVTTSEKLCAGPQGLVPTADAVWVACTTDNVLLRLDPTTLSVGARVPMPVAPDGVVAGPGGALYVVCQQGPTLVVVDSASGVVRSSQVLAAQPQLYDAANLDVAVAPDGIWVSSFGENAVRKVALG